MYVFRPIRPDDLDDLLLLANEASFGLTTLPKDRNLLAARVEHAVRSFASPPHRPNGADYLFGLEDSDSGRLMGTSAIVSKVGGYQPFYAYRIQTKMHQSEQLDVCHRMRVLNLLVEHDGPSEIGSLFLHPAARQSAIGRLLSRSRFLYLAEYPECFEDEIIAEMRGRVSATGDSPFWDALGRHFFRVDFPTADYLSTVDKAFIADLMPTVPIYIDLLPPEARRVIGKVHPSTAAALHLLLQEGFKKTRLVDIFEAGPIIRARCADLHVVRENERLPVTSVVSAVAGDVPYLVATTGRQMRCVSVPIARHRDGVRLSRAAATALGVARGDAVRIIPLRS
jgi:arginine N-succinyltransferase